MNNFRKARKNVGLTQEDVASKLGVTRPAYVHYEQGDRECSFATLRKLADIFNVTTDYLLGNDAGAEPVGGDESRLLGYFRAMPEAGRQALLMVAQQMQVSAR